MLKIIKNSFLSAFCLSIFIQPLYATSLINLWLKPDDIDVLTTVETLKKYTTSKWLNPLNLFYTDQNADTDLVKASRKLVGDASSWYTGGADDRDIFKDENGAQQFFILANFLSTRNNLVALDGEDDINDYCSQMYNAQLWCPKSEYEQKLVYSNLFIDIFPYLETKKMDFETHEKTGFFTMWTAIERKSDQVWFSKDPSDYFCRNSQSWASVQSFNESAFHHENMEGDDNKCVNIGERWSLKWNGAKCEKSYEEFCKNDHDCDRREVKTLGRPVCVSTDYSLLSSAKQLNGTRVELLQRRLHVFREEVKALVGFIIFMVLILYGSLITGCCFCCCCGCCCGCCAPCRHKKKENYGNGELIMM